MESLNYSLFIQNRIVGILENLYFFFFLIEIQNNVYIIMWIRVYLMYFSLKSMIEEVIIRHTFVTPPNVDISNIILVNC